MKQKTRLEKSIEQSKEFKKNFGRSFSEIQQELGLKYPICFDDEQTAL